MSSTSSLNSAVVDSQLPRVRVTPDSDRTEGDLAAGLSAYYGLEPDPWQRYILDDWLGFRGSRYAALTCGLSVPRQNGKNALLEMRELYGAIGLGERILHTAHEVKTAQKHFRRLRYFFGESRNDPAARFPEINRLVEDVRKVNGQEAILLRNGGSIELAARSKNSGRGFTVDVLVMDEAQELADEDLEALMPTTSASPLRNPQWIFTGTPPAPGAHGEVFSRVRQEALDGESTNLAWAEWSPAEDADPDDPATWERSNPGIESGRLQMEVISGERARFSTGGFMRERLGRWDENGGAGRAITKQQWSDVAVLAAPSEGARALGVAFSLDGMRLSIAGAIIPDESLERVTVDDQPLPAGAAHAELIDAYGGSMETGLAPLADWMASRWRDYSGFVLSGRAGATVLADMLRKRKVPDRRVIVASTPVYLQSCAGYLDSVRAKTVTHLKSEGQAALDDAVEVTDKIQRSRVDGAWSWTSANGDHVHVEAVSLALYGARTMPPRRIRDADESKPRGRIL